MDRLPGYALSVVLAAIISLPIHAQDPLPPDADAILNPEPLPGNLPVDAPEEMPSFDELTGAGQPRPPISFQTEARPAPVTEVGGLPPTIRSQTGDTRPGGAVQPQADTDEAIVSREREPAAENAGHLRNNPSLHTALLVVAAGLTLLLPAGFSLVHAGLGRARNVAHTTLLAFAAFAAALLGYWLSGFALEMGGAGANAAGRATRFGAETSDALGALTSLTVAGAERGLAGGGMFFMGGPGLTADVWALFLFHGVLAGFCAMLVAGAFMERGRLAAGMLAAFVVGAAIQPLIACWIWGGGWLAGLGAANGLGHGYLDVGGATVIHLTAGILAAGAVWMLGPRAGRFNSDGTINAIPGHNLNMVAMGVLLASAGWLGLIVGMAIPDLEGAMPRMAVCTLFGGAGGATAGLAMSWVLLRRPDPLATLRGWLAGLVACSAGCAFYDPWAAIVVGGIAGLLVGGATHVVLHGMKLDDPAGIISVHGVCGAWGALAAGLFASDTGLAAWNGVDGPVGGLLFGNAGQLGVQAVGIVATALAALLGGLAVFGVLKAVPGLRVSEDTEVFGLDRGELGAPGYQADVIPEVEDATL